MNPIYSGAATLLAGTVAFSLFRFKTSDKAIDKPLSALSEEGQTALDAVCGGSNPSNHEDPEIALSWRDRWAIFYNSRRQVMATNRARLWHPTDVELPILLDMLQKRHAKLRWLLFLAAIESIIGKLGLGSITHYTRELLWTYGEELELLDQITKKCGPLEGHAIRAIL
jgi:hypothetical protein